MENKKGNNDFTPSVAISPGETIRENMDFLGMNQKELAIRLGITTKHLSNVFNGNAPITYDTAIKLQTVIGPSAEFWMNLETNYQLNKARLEKQEAINAELEIIKNIPYKKMSELGWIEAVSDKVKRVLNCREFFEVASLKYIQESYSVRYRKQKAKKDISDLGILAWLRQSEIKGLDVDVDKFNKKKLKAMISNFRELTLKEPKEFYPEMQRLCASCGIALVIVPSLPKTYICGATIRNKDRVILSLSVRGKRADSFWFTFFHEIAHILNHSLPEFHINEGNNDEEDEADNLAREYLISDKDYEKFIEEYDYKNKQSIIEYSKKLRIAPCILVGRMLYDGLIEYANYSDLRPIFGIV